jgi:hypothetical protein
MVSGERLTVVINVEDRLMAIASIDFGRSGGPSRVVVLAARIAAFGPVDVPRHCPRRRDTS